MARNFIILFQEKEGSTPIVRLLDNFDSIDIVHQVANGGWEPFDLNCSGPISSRDYSRCLELIYGDDSNYMDRLNAIYTRTAKNPLRPFNKDNSVGFKMRFRPQHSNRWLKLLTGPRFRSSSIRCFRDNDVVVFVTVRQDVFRLALSKYHGDGSGKPGHLQFKLADNEIDRAQIPKIQVDLDAFRKVLARCERRLEQKRRLLERLGRNGVTAWPLFYESFCNDKKAFFTDVLARLELPSTEEDIDAVLEKGTQFKKVHSHDIREFVVNADEVLEEFGEPYISW
jgi:hypothetical protein